MSIIEVPFVRVGVGVLIRREGKILLGLRGGAHGGGTWCPPGGHLEYRESFVDCAMREVAEECGVRISMPILSAVTNDFFDESGKHYVTLHMVADWISGEAERLEPKKCARWGWFLPEALPSPLFEPSRQLFAAAFDPFAVGINGLVSV